MATSHHHHHRHPSNYLHDHQVQQPGVGEAHRDLHSLGLERNLFVAKPGGFELIFTTKLLNTFQSRLCNESSCFKERAIVVLAVLKQYPPRPPFSWTSSTWPGLAFNCQNYISLNFLTQIDGEGPLRRHLNFKTNTFLHFFRI